MKHIPILPDIELTQLNGELVLTDKKEPVNCAHVEFLLSKLAHQVFTADIESMARGLHIRAILLSLLKGSERSFSLEDADHAKLCVSLKDGSKLEPTLAHNFFAFAMVAINAPSEEKAV